jgi:hypothetical protein
MGEKNVMTSNSQQEWDSGPKMPSVSADNASCQAQVPQYHSACILAPSQDFNTSEVE